MKKIARKQFKALLLLGLFFLAVCYVHTYPDPMPDYQVHVLWKLSRWLGIRDPDDLYFVAMVTVQLAVSIAVWFYLSRRLGIRDPDDPLFAVVVFGQFIVAIFVWLLVSGWLRIDERNDWAFTAMTIGQTVLLVCVYVAVVGPIRHFVGGAYHEGPRSWICR
ncbi:hypothetical protein LJ656_18345 [Paraburkholderia sp. MMS20-SJTR3]|uniref:Uncharacterized protein n=1 Tax=Paraburkholderia sejongensis TaxID=2886946 RepID=A0ABS8JY25_9BURK|nr:hypothetical protein [Paraburkholderia sp. MMS20-SJTR3]MCC8394554.1 hypothetical protein [Paraburkholderia sp. MMS20-SJTR3]